MSSFQITGILLSVHAIEVEHTDLGKRETGRRCFADSRFFSKPLFVPRIGEQVSLNSTSGVMGRVIDLWSTITTLPMQSVQLTVEVNVGDVDKLVSAKWKRTSKKLPSKKTPSSN